MIRFLFYSILKQTANVTRNLLVSLKGKQDPLTPHTQPKTQCESHMTQCWLLRAGRGTVLRSVPRTLRQSPAAELCVLALPPVELVTCSVRPWHTSIQFAITVLEERCQQAERPK